MKKKSLLIALSSLLAFIANSQHQLNGTVKDAADDSPIPYATVALLHPDSSAVTGVMTVDDGKFVIEKVAAGDYIVRISFIGYETVYRNVKVPEQGDLGEITLSENANILNEVIVTASRPLLVMKADRYVVNVSSNIQSAGRDALDILRNTPGLLVDQNGNVTVMGKGVQIWIDGRPSQMSGEQLKSFLHSMQGGEIERIEVITNPSSRYEAEGSGGIIDIRTKKGLDSGVNGTFTAGYQQGRMDNENTGLSMNWRREKFNLFGNYAVNRYKWWSFLDQTNIMQTHEGEITLNLESDSRHSEAGLRHAVRAGMDYFLNPNNIFGIIVNTYHADDGIFSLKGVTDISPDYQGINHSTADNRKTDIKNGVQVNMNYQTTFTNAKQQLNFDLDYARFSSDQLQRNANSY